MKYLITENHFFVKDEFQQGAGFTIIEAVMAIVITGFIVAALGAMSEFMVADTYKMIDFRNDVVNSAKRAFTMMAREIRQIKDDRSVLAANSGEFKFNDVDDTAIDYTLQGNNLMRNSDILCGFVRSLQFTYIDRSGNEISSPSVRPDKTDIWLVKIEINLKRGDEEKKEVMLIHPRNFFRNQ